MSCPKAENIMRPLFAETCVDKANARVPVGTRFVRLVTQCRNRLKHWANYQKSLRDNSQFSTPTRNSEAHFPSRRIRFLERGFFNHQFA